MKGAKERNLSWFTASTDSTDWRLAKNKSEKRKGGKERNGSEVEKGMLWTRFITEVQRIVEFVHSCRLTIYNRPPLFLPAILCSRKMIKRPFFLFFFLPLGLSLRRNKRCSFSNFLAFMLTSTRIRAFSAYLSYFHATFNLVFSPSRFVRRSDRLKLRSDFCNIRQEITLRVKSHIVRHENI